MPLLVDAARMLCLAVVLAAPNPSFAQRTMYRCSTDGRAYLSDRPCDGRPGLKVASMSPGERADHDRFEATWQARCKSS